jgi:ATP-dependent DNA helicase PIF1
METKLSDEQHVAFLKYLKGHNLFITGPGGVGKSVLIQKINESATNWRKSIQICALTGCAAVLLKCHAKTIHSWAGIGLGQGPLETIISKIRHNRSKLRNWRQVDILVIDEVSMMSSKLFHLLNEIGKRLRCSSSPFGGIQVIFCGDFYQLPPVGDPAERESCQFCFEHPQWETVFPKDNCVQLKKIFRQTDEVYARILNEIRVGRIRKSSFKILSQYVGREIPGDLAIRPTKIFPLRHKVEHTNSMEMDKIKEDEHVYKIKTVTDIPVPKTMDAIPIGKLSSEEVQYEIEYLSRNLLCDSELKLKLHAQVMCVINIEAENLCNGSQGIVTGFANHTNLPIVRFHNGVERIMAPHVWQSENIPSIGVTQIPLILSWAITIHKSQGASIDAAEIDIGSSIFECGQTYVALSRVKSMNGLYLTSFDISRIQIFNVVKHFYEGLEKHDSEKTEKIAPSFFKR